MYLKTYCVAYMREKQRHYIYTVYAVSWTTHLLQTDACCWAPVYFASQLKCDVLLRVASVLFMYEEIIAIQQGLIRSMCMLEKTRSILKIPVPVRLWVFTTLQATTTKKHKPKQLQYDLGQVLGLVLGSDYK